MRITFLLPYAGVSGGVRVVAIYAERLARRGHEVAVISQPHWIRRPRALVHDFLTRKLPMLLRGQREPSFLEGLPIEHRQLERVRPVTADDLPEADVLVATWWETAEWAAALPRSKGQPLYFVQGPEALHGQPEERVRATYRLPMRKLAVSRWLAESIRETAGGEDIAIIPNAVDAAQFHAPPRGKQREPTVGMMYDNKPRRGCEATLEAVRRAQSRVPGLRLLSFGTHVPPPTVTLPPRTHHEVLPAQDRLREIYSACDAWLFGSRVEGFGLPIVEAMACRTPVIATPAGAAPELLEGGGGRLVALHDPADMAEAIEEVLTLPDAEWRAMSERAFRTVSDYTWEDATDRFEAAMVEAADAPRGELALT